VTGNAPMTDVLPVPRPDREVGPLARALSRAIPGVATTVAQVSAYARYWDEHNHSTVTGPGTEPWFVVMGDSTAQGVGAAHPRGGWAGQLHDRLSAAGRPHRLLNLSVSGARTGDLIDVQLHRYEAFLDHVGTPALTVVEIGANDAFASVNVAAIRRNLTTIAERLPSGSVLSLLPVAGPATVSRMANATVRRLAQQHRLVVGDIGRHSRPRRDRLGADAFHPNELGYGEWARGLAESIGISAG